MTVAFIVGVIVGWLTYRLVRYWQSTGQPGRGVGFHPGYHLVDDSPPPVVVRRGTPFPDDVPPVDLPPEPAPEEGRLTDGQEYQVTIVRSR